LLGYVDHTGRHQLNRVLTRNNNVVKSGAKPYAAAVMMVCIGLVMSLSVAQSSPHEVGLYSR
jgi:hypothetical protein